MPQLALLLLFGLPALPAPAEEAATIAEPPDHKYVALASSLGLIVGFGAGHAYAGVYGDYGFVFTILDLAFAGAFTLGGFMVIIEAIGRGPGAGVYLAGIGGGALLATRVVEAITAGVSANRQNQPRPPGWSLSPAVLPGDRAPALGLSFGMQF